MPLPGPPPYALPLPFHSHALTLGNGRVQRRWEPTSHGGGRRLLLFHAEHDASRRRRSRRSFHRSVRSMASNLEPSHSVVDAHRTCQSVTHLCGIRLRSSPYRGEVHLHEGDLASDHRLRLPVSTLLGESKHSYQRHSRVQLDSRVGGAVSRNSRSKSIHRVHNADALLSHLPPTRRMGGSPQSTAQHPTGVNI